MDTATQILVIIVSSLLSLMLLLAIVLIVVVLRFVARVRRIVEKAEHVIDNAESAATMFTRAAGPIGLLKTIANIIDSVNKHRKGK
jgi:hypothetical protein